MPKRITDEDEFFKNRIKVDETTGCWNWQRHCCINWGYGVYGRRAGGVSKQYKAHRGSYEFYVGPIPDGMLVCHKCDNPKCINPDHLFLGTNSDNMQDMWNKGRHPIPTSKPGAKLTVEQVREIRRLEGTATLRKIGEAYGVCAQTILDIFKREKWKDIE